jgi:hypothetical protein
MGISGNCIKFLNYAQSRGVDFARTLTLGRQQIFLTDDSRNELFKQFNDKQLPANGAFAEPLFHLLGANTVESIDYSDFEDATIIHDLNERVSQNHLNTYSTIFDGGTLEHVYNFPVAIKNCMDMLNVGGHFVAITPTNNYCGHGFYQFSPELFFALFTSTHGFNLKLVVIVVENKAKNVIDWFEVKDPKSVGGRVTITNSYPTSLMIIAEKINETKSIILKPFQSDYQSIWDVHQSVKTESVLNVEANWVYYYRRWLPKWIRDIVYKLRNRSKRQLYVKDLGVVNPTYFKKLDI